jgi:flavin-dependent dehydrogenase
VNSRLRKVDVAIVGAGPAGAASAIRLARKGMQVELIERSRYNSPRVGESLAPSIAPLMRELGVWRTFCELAPLPSFGTRSIWGSETTSSHSHLQSPYGQGWHVERCLADAMLADEARKAGAVLRCETMVESIEHRSHAWKLNLRSTRSSGQPEALSARVLIDATGRNANVAGRLGAKRILFDRLVGVCARYNSTHEHGERHILLETCNEGWWYTAPTSTTRIMTMLMTDSDLCGAGQNSAVSHWDELLSCTTASARRLCDAGRFKRLEKPWVVSAVSQRLDRRGDDRPWIAVGDAALAVDPISGSGVVRALRAAERAADCAEEMLANPSSGPLAAYEAASDRDCTHYLIERIGYYAIEQRFGHSKFWNRRRLPGRNVA